LRASRFLKESEDKVAVYRMYRGVDIRDVVDAHLLAMNIQKEGFYTCNISAKTRFLPEDIPHLFQNPKEVIARRYPFALDEFEKRGWRFGAIDRVYVTQKAEEELGYLPKFGLEELLTK